MSTESPSGGFETPPQTHTYLDSSASGGEASESSPNTFKELTDKLAWAVGSTFACRYCKRTRARDWAIRAANELMEVKDAF